MGTGAHLTPPRQSAPRKSDLPPTLANFLTGRPSPHVPALRHLADRPRHPAPSPSSLPHLQVGSPVPAQRQDPPECQRQPPWRLADLPLRHLRGDLDLAPPRPRGRGPSPARNAGSPAPQRPGFRPGPCLRPHPPAPACQPCRPAVEGPSPQNPDLRPPLRLDDRMPHPPRRCANRPAGPTSGARPSAQPDGRAGAPRLGRTADGQSSRAAQAGDGPHHPARDCRRASRQPSGEHHYRTDRPPPRRAPRKAPALLRTARRNATPA